MFGMVSQRSAAVLLFLLAWELLPNLDVIDRTLLPPFSKVVLTLEALISNGQLQTHIAASLSRSAAGLTLALLVAVPVGMLIGWFIRVKRFLDPLLQLFRNTSTLALIPVFVVLLGIGEISKFAIIFWAASMPLLINSITGVRQIDSDLIKAARSMGISDCRLLYTVILPAAMPLILSGFRLAATESIVIVVVAEMLGADTGLGYMIQFTGKQSMYAGIVVISLIGVAVHVLTGRLERKLLRWREMITE